MHCHYIMV